VHVLQLFLITTEFSVSSVSALSAPAAHDGAPRAYEVPRLVDLLCVCVCVCVCFFCLFGGGGGGVNGVHVATWCLRVCLAFAPAAL
jgi:hypothetical protein